MITRRRAIKGLAAMCAVAPLRAGYAQRVHRVAVLIHGPERAQQNRYMALRAGLKDHGYEEGKNLRLDVRWNDGGLDQLPDLAAELLRDKPEVVVAAPVLTAAAVQKRTSTVPIVIMWGAGAVKLGLARSFARPGTNVTGFETQNEDLTPKHMELLKTVAPRISRLAVLNTGKYIFHDEAWLAARQAAKALKLELIDVRVAERGDLTRLASSCAGGGCDALYVMPDPILINWRPEIIGEAERLRLPAAYFQPEFVLDGGLMSYSANIEDMCRRAAGHVDKILKGRRPTELPIEHPTKFELIINLKAAKQIGLTIPPSMLARADRVIE